MKQNILVMGGSYFIGKRIVEVLLQNQYTVFTLNRGTRKKNDGRVNELICDRNNPEEMKIVLSNHQFDVVIDVCGLDKLQAEILCNSLNMKKIKTFVFISSSAVYDVENLAIPFAENAQLNENKYWTFYGQNKIEAESYYTEQFSKTDTNLIILRPPYVYGEDNYAQRESFIFDHICKDKPIIIPNTNTQLQFIYSTDLAEIIIKLINTTSEPVSIFNVGNKKAVTMREWIEYCEKAVGKEAEIIEYDYKNSGRDIRSFFPFFGYDNVLDVSKINKIYSMETDFEIGLKKSYEWYYKNKENICFKESVAQNEADILMELKKIF